LEDIVLARQLIEKYTEKIHPTIKTDAVADDPDDNRILECAVAAGSQYVIKADKHLPR